MSAIIYEIDIWNTDSLWSIIDLYEQNEEAFKKVEECLEPFGNVW